MFPGRRTLIAVISLTVLVLAPALATPNELGKLDRALYEIAAKGNATGDLAIIVQTVPGLRQMDLGELEALGGTRRCTFASIDGFAGSIPARNLGKLAALDWVKHVSSDATVRKLLDVTAPAVGAPMAWNGLGYTGAGVSVAVIDSGLTFHMDFASKTGWWRQRVIGGYDWVAQSRYFLGNDRCGHGSSVAGAIAGNGLQSTNRDPSAPKFSRTFVGIAPEANLINCRVLDSHGVGAVSDVISAIEWCVAHADRYNIRVINLSLGHPIRESYVTDPLCQACEYAWRNGIVVVVAAGNRGGRGYSSILSPANDPYVISVGAVNTNGTPDLSDDELCGYSSRGPTFIDHIIKPDIVAPGNRVVSIRHAYSLLDRTFRESNLVPLDYYKIDPRRWDRSGYFVLSGTSLSAAVVSGAAALMVEADPDATPDTIKTRLMLTARKSPQYGPLWQGAGYLSIPNALRSAATSLTPSKSPRLEVATNGGTLASSSPQIANYGNIIWDPTPPGTPPPSSSDIYPDEPLDEVYQPAQDPLWGAYNMYSSYGADSGSTCRADLSQIAIHGEDHAVYVGAHGPVPGTLEGDGN